MSGWTKLAKFVPIIVDLGALIFDKVKERRQAKRQKARLAELERIWDAAEAAAKAAKGK